MKIKHLSIFAALAMAATGCYDDSALNSRLDKVEGDITGINSEITNIKAQISQINSNIAALQTVVDALEDNVYVSSVTEVKDQTTQDIIGYTIMFTDDRIITIYNGTDGEDGPQGPQGEPGQDGVSPAAPQIGLAMANGVYCWTVDGEFLLDAEDKAIPATGADGKDGKTPELRINEGYWEIFNGEEWEVLGSATGEVTAVDAVFSGVKETSEGVVFILADGSKIVVPRDMPFGLVFDKVAGYEVVGGKTVSIPYTVHNSTEGTVVDAIASGYWTAEVEMTDYISGNVKVTAPEDGKDGKVLVYANDGKGKTDIKTLSFSNGVLSAVAQTTEIPAVGGEISVSITSNINYDIEVSESWLRLVPPTKAGATVTETVTFAAGANSAPEVRTAEIRVLDPQGTAVQTFSISQASSGAFVAPVFADENFKAYILAAFDTNEDGTIDQTEAGNIENIEYDEATAGALTSVAGVEAFYNMKNFKVIATSDVESTVSAIDFSKNSKLETIYIQLKSLTELNVEGLGYLKDINVANSGVTSLDVTTLANLESLRAQNTKLASIDLSYNTKLTNLSVSGTPMTVLNTSNCPKLVTLVAGSSVLAELTLDNPALKELNLTNGLADTDVDFSSLVSLERLLISNAKVNEINLSNSPYVNYVLGSTYANLETVDLSAASGLMTFNISGYSNLQTVRLNKAVEGKFTLSSYYNYEKEEYVVPSIIYVGGETTEIDDYTYGISDEYVRKYIINKYDADSDGKINENEVASVKELDLSYYGLTTAAGLEVFPLEKLNLSNNKLTEFDAKAITTLKHLDLNNNMLTEINVRNTSIEYLDVSYNSLTTNLDYYTLSYSLKYLYASNNPALIVDPTDNSDYIVVDISYTATASMYLTYWGAENLKVLNIEGTRLSGALKFTDLTGLQTLNVSNTTITSVDVTDAASYGNIKHIYAENTPLEVVIVGPGNSLADGAIEGADDCAILNVTNPSKDIASNIYSYITGFTAGTGATEKDFTINYAKTSKGFVINAGGEASITASAGRKVLKFFAIGVNGTPTVEIVRSSGKSVLSKSEDYSWQESYKSTAENPFAVRKNDAAAKNETKLLIDGDTDWYSFNLGAMYDSNHTVEGETITFRVTGNEGEKVIIFGINMSSSRGDEE